MKTRRIFICLIIAGVAIFTLASLTTNKEKKFYYAFDEKTPLVPQENTLLVKFTEGFNKVNTEQFLNESATGVNVKWHNPLVAEISTGSSKSTEYLKLKLKLRGDVSSCHSFYRLEDGLEMGVTDEILIRFLPGVSEQQQKELSEKFNTEVVKKTKIYQKLIVPKGDDALEIANKYFETGLVEFSTPNFISYFELNQIIPNDTYFGNQVTCHNIGQTFNDGHSGTNDADIDAPEAWGMTTGCNDIIIAVLDNGVTSNHPDLPNTRQVRFDWSNFGDGNANDPSPTGNYNHGNACAGVIAATMGNNQGIAGVAPDCRIMPIRIFNSNGKSVIPELIADAIELAVDNGADILSNSWSRPTTNQYLYPCVNLAILYAIQNNRVVIFGAGNSARHSVNIDGIVGYPANINIEGVITVGASDRNDEQADYSPSSSLIDIVAPSHRAYPPEVYYPEPGGISGETGEMWSLDIPDSTGYNPYPDMENMPHPPAIGEVLPNTGTNNLAYTGRFGGTSHSCPVVAGVAALVLSVDQSLTYLEIFDILTATADEVGGYTYENGRSYELGYGRVNACKAVFEAFCRIMSVSGPSLVCTSNSTFTLQNRPPGSTVIWGKSSNLRYEGGQGTDNYQVKAYWYSAGPGWVDATITSDCGDVTIRKNIPWVGTPDPDDLVINNPDNDPDNTLCEGEENQLIASHNGSQTILDYDWDYPGWWSHYEVGAKDFISFVIVPYSFPYVDIKLRAANQCGESEWRTERFYPNQNCGYFFNFSPNPADEYVEISIDEIKLAENEIDYYEVRIYNSLKIAVYETGKTKEPLLRINTKQFQNGVYFIYFSAGEKTDVKQLVVSH